MEFLYPMGAWALLAGLVILLLYMLKRQYTEQEVPSTFLWKKSLADHTASRPIQKLKRNLLLFLQLLAVILSALFLMQPVIPGEKAGESLLIFDLSASMQAEGRLEEAKERAAAMLNSMDGADRISVFSVGQETKQLLIRSTDKQAALTKIRALQAENGGAELGSAISLAKAMKEEIPGLSILVFSDSYETEDPDLQILPPGKPLANRALLSLAAEETAAVARIANYGEACSLTLEIYAEDVLTDVRVLELSEGTVGSVKFSLPLHTKKAKVLIREEDALLADNALEWVQNEKEGIHLLLAGEGNVFWEKAFQLRDSLRLTRTEKGEAESFEDADLYMQEGDWTRIAKTAFSSLIPAEQIREGGSLHIAENDTARLLAENMRMESVYVKEFHEVQGGIPLFLIDGYTAAAVDPEKGEILLGFDVEKSNFPVKYDFPVFVQNVLEYLLPNSVSGLDNAYCGEKLEIHLNPRAENAWIETPSGRNVQVTNGSFRDTNEKGIYRLVQSFSGGEKRESCFVLKIPETESELRKLPAQNAEEGAKSVIQYSRKITEPILLLLLLLLLIEWGVSRFGRTLR